MTVMVVESRRLPSTDLQVDILIEQDNRCIYCGHKFGDLVIRKNNDWQWLELNWDHFIPYAYTGNNEKSNWVAACHLCNRYKSSLIFNSIFDVRMYIMDKALTNKHDPMPFWNLEERERFEQELTTLIEPEPESSLDDLIKIRVSELIKLSKKELRTEAKAWGITLTRKFPISGYRPDVDLITDIIRREFSEPNIMYIG